jgi:hypothetical protein
MLFLSWDQFGKSYDVSPQCVASLWGSRGCSGSNAIGWSSIVLKRAIWRGTCQCASPKIAFFSYFACVPQSLVGLIRRSLRWRTVCCVRSKCFVAECSNGQVSSTPFSVKVHRLPNENAHNRTCKSMCLSLHCAHS